MLDCKESCRLRLSLVQLTSEGPANEWVDRIENIAREAGLPLEKICWQGTPEHVASGVVDFASSSGHTAALKRAIEEKSQKKKGEMKIYVPGYPTRG